MSNSTLSASSVSLHLVFTRSQLGTKAKKRDEVAWLCCWSLNQRSTSKMSVSDHYTMSLDKPWKTWTNETFVSGLASQPSPLTVLEVPVKTAALVGTSGSMYPAWVRKPRCWMEAWVKEYEFMIPLPVNSENSENSGCGVGGEPWQDRLGLKFIGEFRNQINQEEIDAQANCTKTRSPYWESSAVAMTWACLKVQSLH